jgi:DNA modification methylase
VLVQERPVTQIRPYENNPRYNDEGVEAVAASLQEFGFRQPIVVDDDGVIVVGHTRFKAALKLGMKSVPVHVASGLTPAQIRAYRIADNQTATLSSWNDDLLVLELAELQKENFDVDLTGFSADELMGMMQGGPQEGLTDPDVVPEPPDKAISQPGDLWVLGDHRLLCGDSAKAEDVDRLLNGATIHLVNTDPPYNVKVEPRSNNAIAAGLSSFGEPALKNHQGFDIARHKNKRQATTKKLRAKDRPLENDFVTDGEFDRLLHGWFGNIARVLAPGRAFYIWGGYANCANYPPVLKAVGLYFAQAIIWDKQHPVLTRKDFMGAHEWCQPPDTLVATPDGQVPISTLRDNDRVVSFYPHSSAIVGLREGLGVRRATRHYQGDLYGVVVAGRQSWSTDGHFWSVRLTKEYPLKWCVYLMRRGPWWRVGITKMRTTWGFGLKGRLCHEHGDEAWILSLHDSHADARMHEQLVSVQFGIPQTCWVQDGVATRRQDSHIEMLYSRLDLQKLELAAIAALESYHRRREYPYLTASDTRSKFGSRQSLQVRACNLLPEITEIPVPNGGQTVRWSLLDTIDVQRYSGPVHSLGVETHAHYLADGLVTHNCFYGWREGAAHQFFGPANATDLWSIKKVNPQSMEHLTQKPVELAARAIGYSSRPGENVLDLFGGSGSTLIAAEQTNRKAFLMELDALYADLIVDRWQRFTGKQAVHAETGALYPKQPPATVEAMR